MNTEPKTRNRAPALWLLSPITIGYLMGNRFYGVPPLAPASIALCASFAACYFSFGKGTMKKYGWAGFFLLGSTFWGWSYFLQRVETPSPTWAKLPPREALFNLEIIRTYPSADPYGRVSGIAEIKETPPPLKSLLHQKIYFQLQALKNSPAPHRSEVYRAGGILHYQPSAENADPFREYLLRSGVFLELRRGKFFRKIDSGGFFHRFRANQNRRLENILQSGKTGNSELKNVYVAILLGKKAVLSARQKEAYLKTGTMHFFAISGLHVAAVAATLNYFFLILRIREKYRVILGLAALFLYVQITGAGSSAIRAFLMVTFFWGARVFLRQTSSFSALLVSALAVLLWEPRQLWNAGFQMSYAVVAAILLYGLPLIRRLESPLKPFQGIPESDLRRHHKAGRLLTQYGLEIFAVSLAATLLSSPLSIQFFHLFTPGAIVLNMILVTVAGLLIVCGFISILGGLFAATAISAFFNHGALVLIWIMETSIRGFLSLPGFFWKVEYNWPSAGYGTVLALLSAMLISNSRRWMQFRLIFFIPPLILLLSIMIFVQPTRN